MNGAEVVEVGNEMRSVDSFANSNSSAFERHYRIGELATMWKLGRETVRLLVKDDPGVIKISLGRNKRHTTYSVPESAAQRIHTRLLSEP